MDAAGVAYQKPSFRLPWNAPGFSLVSSSRGPDIPVSPSQHYGRSNCCGRLGTYLQRIGSKIEVVALMHESKHRAKPSKH